MYHDCTYFKLDDVYRILERPDPEYHPPSTEVLPSHSEMSDIQRIFTVHSYDQTSNTLVVIANRYWTYANNSAKVLGRDFKADYFKDKTMKTISDVKKVDDCDLLHRFLLFKNCSNTTRRITASEQDRIRILYRSEDPFVLQRSIQTVPNLLSDPSKFTRIIIRVLPLAKKPPLIRRPSIWEGESLPPKVAAEQP